MPEKSESMSMNHTDNHIMTLQNLQAYRSAATAHKKGDRYIKICSKLQIDASNLSEILNQFFSGCANIFQELESKVRV